MKTTSNLENFQNSKLQHLHTGFVMHKLNKNRWMVSNYTALSPKDYMPIQLGVASQVLSPMTSHLTNSNLHSIKTRLTHPDSVRLFTLLWGSDTMANWTLFLWSPVVLTSALLMSQDYLACLPTPAMSSPVSSSALLLHSLPPPALHHYKRFGHFASVRHSAKTLASPLKTALTDSSSVLSSSPLLNILPICNSNHTLYET